MNDTRKPEEQTSATESKSEEQISAVDSTGASDSSSEKTTNSAPPSSTDSSKAADNHAASSAASAGDAGASGTQPPASEPKKPATWPGKLALLLSVISLGGVGYLCWQGWELKQSTTSSQGAIAQQVETELANTRAQIADRVSGVSETLGALKSQAESDKQNIAQLQQRLTDAIKQVNATRETSREDFLLAEAEYLLRLANQRVLMEQTATGALTLLKSTDQILRESDDVALYPVREALAQDIAALEAVPSLDTEGIYLQLAALSSQVDNLRVTPITDKRKLPAMLEEITPESVEKSWTEGAAAAWGKAVDKFEKLVVIQHRDEPVEPLMSPEQTYYLQQNLHLMLEQAQLALLQRKQEAFDASLVKAADWVGTYFDDKDATTQSLLRAFAELQEINVAPELPDISGSLKALKAHLSEMARLKQEANR
ncbi:uroporphyrinogen-III C-methyltransferase [Marinobacterium lutimaris]|uniref:Uroporphyrin-3 C-methyltransferase n=1 Tax=Marinobacterium lutimaris TaxID=568106 RepID=A0A1H6CXV2_9GAMM|nr:uroporphyrinogen-III C-methyltransferase [Marinobacterium lutimaris]SEG77989.1 uroporphyrin-3 C-methyltransferase [Marinobacterium lutimaris]